MALFLDLSTGEALDIDRGRVRITVKEKNGKRTRLRIDADKSIPIRKVGEDKPTPAIPREPAT